MNRPLLASLAVGLGLACGVSALVPALAQDRGTPERGKADVKTTDARDDDRAMDRASEWIDKAIQTYQNHRNRMGPNVDQTRKDIEKLRDDLCDVIKLRCDMAVALAEIRAEMAGAQGMAPAPGMMPGYAPIFGPGGTRSPYGSIAEVPVARFDQFSKEERQLIRREALRRELRQLQDQMRGEFEQEHAQTDQIVAQLRDLRSQQRSLQEQMKADRERMQQLRDQGREAPALQNEPTPRTGDRAPQQPKSKPVEPAAPTSGKN